LKQKTLPSGEYKKALNVNKKGNYRRGRVIIKRENQAAQPQFFYEKWLPFFRNNFFK
jgi:hypothetical protein